VDEKLTCDNVCANMQVLVSTDALPVACIHADHRDWTERCAGHAESGLPIERSTFDFCVSTSARGEERQEQGEGGDCNPEHDGSSEEKGGGKEER